MLIIFLFLSLLGSPKECFDLAFGLYSDGVYSLAREEFVNLASKYPESLYSEKAEYYIASSDFYLEKYTQARDEFKKFISTHPTSNLINEANQQLGRAHFELCEYIEAISIYKFLDSPDSRYWLGECHYRIDEIDTALHYYKSVLSESRYIEYAIYSVGFIEMEIGHPEEAILTFNRLIKEYPNTPLRNAALYYAGRIYYEEEDYKSAEERLIKVGGSHEEDASLLLGHTYLKLGFYEQAKQEYKSLISKKYCAAGILGIGDIYYATGELDKALKEYKKIEDNKPLREEVLIRIGRTYFDMMQYDEAQQWFDKVTTPKARLMAANTLFERGRYQEASERYINLHKDIKHEEALYRASLSSFKAGSLSDAEYLALEYLNMGYEEYKSHIHLILGELYYERKVYTKAINEYTKASMDKANEKQALLGLVYSYQKIDDKKNAINTLTELVRLYPENDVLYKSAEIAYSMEEYEMAVTYYNRIEGAEYNIGKVYFDMGKYEDAIVYFKKFVSNYPMNKKSEEALFSIGIAERRMQNYSTSTIVFNELLKLYPSTDYTYDAAIHIGDNYFDMEKYDDAIVTYMKSLSLLPRPLPKDAVKALYGIIDAEYRIRGLMSSLSLASDFIKTNPHISDELYIKMGDLAYQNGEYSRAAEYYQLVKSEKLIPRALYWLGMSYYLLKDTNKAEEIFIRLSKEFSETEFTAKALIILSDIYIDKKNYRKAEDYLLMIKSDEARLKLAEVYIVEDRYSDAEKILNGLVIEGNENTTNRARIKLASIYIGREDTKNSRVYLSAVLEGNNPLLKPEARFLEANSYFKEGDYESAARSYLMVNYLYGENNFISKSLFYAAECYINLENIDEARKFYTMVVKRGDDSLLVNQAKFKLEKIKSE